MASRSETAEIARAEFIRECAMRLFVQESGVTKDKPTKFMTKCLQRAFDFTSMIESYKGGEINFDKSSSNKILDSYDKLVNAINNISITNTTE